MKRRIDPSRLKTYEPIVTVAPTLIKLLELQAKENLKPIDLARFLAAAGGGRERGARTVPISVEVIAMIGAHLVPRSKWTKVAATAKATAARSETALARNARWRRQADEIRRRTKRSTKLPDTEIAARIASDPRQIRNIRRIISKSK